MHNFFLLMQSLLQIEPKKFGFKRRLFKKNTLYINNQQLSLHLLIMYKKISLISQTVNTAII